jgi:hypothetical protein
VVVFAFPIDNYRHHPSCRFKYPNLDASRVSVVDGAGKLLSSQGQDSDFGYTAEQFRLAEQFEGSLNDRIIGILEPILGVGAVQAQVTADMDFTRTESTNEIFDPNVALRSEQTSEDISNNAVVAGPPGGLVPNPPQPALAQQNQPQQPVDDAPDRESRQETRNYEVNKTIQYVRSVPGAVNKLSVAVVVDYKLDENGESVPLDAALLEQVNALVREAVGFNAARGDTVPNNQLSLYRPCTHGATSRAWIARAAMDLGSREGSSRSAGSFSFNLHCTSTNGALLHQLRSSCSRRGRKCKCCASRVQIRKARTIRKLLP